SGTGTATIAYQVEANTSVAQRVGVITVNGQTHTVTQAGSASGSCTCTLSAASAQMAANGGPGSVVVTAGAACQWNASVNAAWIRLTASSGTGTATIAYQVEANASGAQRVGVITVNGQTHTVTQAAGGPEPVGPSTCFAVFEPGASLAAQGATQGTVEVRTETGCAWSVQSSAGWLRVNPAAGTGSTRLQWSVTANTGLEERVATLSAGGISFVLTQSGLAPSGAPSITRVVNDADKTEAVAAGMRVLVRGASLAAGEYAIEKPPCRTTMGGVSVDVIAAGQTKAAALFAISPTELGVQLPYDLAAGDVELRVKHGGGVSAGYRMKMAAAAPRIYRVQHEDGSPVNGDRPAIGGEVVDVLTTGLGAVAPMIAANAVAGDGGETGPAQRTVEQATAALGGRVAEVLYAGLVAGSSGQYNVRLRVPAGVDTGEIPLAVWIGDAESPATTVAAKTAWTEAGLGTIGAAGGEVQAGGVTIGAGAGVLPEGTVLRVRRAEGASEVLIDGIPEARSGELVLALDLGGEADGETMIAIKEDGLPGLTFLRAEVVNGKAKVRVPASGDAEAKAGRDARSSTPFSWMAWAVSGWDHRRSSKGLFTVFFEKKRRSELSSKVDMILEALDTAHQQLGEKVRLSWESRKQWPIEVTISEFTGADKDKWGSEGSVRFGKEGQTICLNTRFMTTDEEMRIMVGTAAHELFHVLQNLYDARSGLYIAKQGGTAPWVWFEEAASTWFERLVVSDPETYIPSTLRPGIGPRAAGSSDNFAFLKEGLGRTRSQEHGYGASMFLQFVSDELGAEKVGAALKPIGQGNWWTNSVDPLTALEDALGGASIMKYWREFCERYFAGAVYGKKLMFPTPELFAGMTGERHVFQGPSDGGKDYGWSAPPLSAEVVLFNFRNANFPKDTPVRIRFRDSKNYEVGAHLYRMKTLPDGSVTWTKAGDPATAFEFLNGEEFGANGEHLLLMTVNPWKTEGQHKVSVRAGQPKFKNGLIRLNGGGSFRTETIQDGSYRNPHVKVNGNEVEMWSYTTSVVSGGTATYATRAKFILKGALLERLEYYYRNARPGDVYEYEVILKNLPRTEVTNSFDGSGDVRWFVFEAGTAASKTGVADKVVKYYGKRIFQGKEYPQEWNDRQTIEVRLIAPDPE
ncbi:MAG: hypothetical protein JNK48_02280, partial [Bryobacterales bacterium]|nr:hypothetical protein [Bryobacterales bacterium]